MKPTPHIRALADLLVGVVLREMKNPRRATSAEGFESCSHIRRKQRDNYNKYEKCPIPNNER